MAATIHQEAVFKASPNRVYRALIDGKEHAAFTGAPASIKAEAGGAVSTHGGQIEGRILQLAPDRLIVEAWRPAAWPEGTYSIVRIELKSEDKGTRLVLDHTGIPEGASDMLDQGWKMRYWEPLTKYLA